MTTQPKHRHGFVYNDGGRKEAGYKGHTGDCVARAISIVTGKPYQEIYNVLASGNAAQRITRDWRAAGKKTASYGINVKRKWFKDYMSSLGFKWIPTMKIGQGCKVHLNANELPMGRLVVSVSKHYTAMIDGVINDTHDPRERGVTIYPTATPSHLVPKGARLLPDDGGWAYEPERCVYGYWLFDNTKTQAVGA